MSKTVTWVGGPHDGSAFEVDERGMSLDVMLDPLPPSLVQPPSLVGEQRVRVARVPIVYTPQGWRAIWNQRVERDW